MGREVVELIKHRKIALFINSMGPGGAERVISILLKNSFSDKEKFLILLEDNIFYSIPSNITVIKLHKNLKSTFKKMLSLVIDPFVVGIILRKYEIDCVISFLERPNIINFFANLIKKHKTIVSVRSVLSQHYKKLPSGKLMSFMHRLVFKHVDLIVVNSRSIYDDLIKNFGVNKNKIKIIFNPVDTEIINTLKVKDVKDIQFNFPTIVSVGRFYPVKNHLLLLKSFAEVLKQSKAQLILIGDGPLRHRISKECKLLGIEKYVKFLGFLKNPFKYMSKSDIFVLSSNTEGFPNVLVEALACNLSVISTLSSNSVCEILNGNLKCEFDSGKKIIFGKYGIIVEKNSVSALSTAILKLLKDKKLMRYYKCNSTKAIERFSVVKISAEWNSLVR